MTNITDYKRKKVEQVEKFEEMLTGVDSAAVLRAMTGTSVDGTNARLQQRYDENQLKDYTVAAKEVAAREREAFEKYQDEFDA